MTTLPYHVTATQMGDPEFRFLLSKEVKAVNLLDGVSEGERAMMTQYLYNAVVGGNVPSKEQVLQWVKENVSTTPKKALSMALADFYWGGVKSTEEGEAREYIYNTCADFYAYFRYDLPDPSAIPVTAATATTGGGGGAATATIPASVGATATIPPPPPPLESVKDRLAKYLSNPPNSSEVLLLEDFLLTLGLQASSGLSGKQLSQALDVLVKVNEAEVNDPNNIPIMKRAAELLDIKVRAQLRTVKMDSLKITLGLNTSVLRTITDEQRAKIRLWDTTKGVSQGAMDFSAFLIGADSIRRGNDDYKIMQGILNPAPQNGGVPVGSG